MDSEGRTVLDELYELGGGYDKLRRAAESRQQGEPVRLTKTEKLVERMLVHLYETAPEAGPDNMGGNVKSLGDGIYEFRAGWGGRNPGTKIRVTFFRGRGRQVIVCVSAFSKTSRTPNWVIPEAQEVKAEYFQMHAAGRIEIVD
jgi:putative component of toxin-antitoxin plasmid stabilization module